MRQWECFWVCRSVVLYVWRQSFRINVPGEVWYNAVIPPKSKLFFFKLKGWLRDHNIHLILNPKVRKSSEVDFILFHFSLVEILKLKSLSSILIPSCNVRLGMEYLIVPYMCARCPTYLILCDLFNLIVFCVTSINY